MNASMVEEVSLMPINAINAHDYIDLLVLGADGQMAQYMNSIQVKRGKTSNRFGSGVDMGTIAITFYMGEVLSGDISETLAINQDIILWAGTYAPEAQLMEAKLVDIDVRFELVPNTGKYKKYVTIYGVDNVAKLANYKLQKAWAVYEKPTKYNDFLPGSETWLERLTNLETRINALSADILYPQTYMSFPATGEAKVVYAI